MEKSRSQERGFNTITDGNFYFRADDDGKHYYFSRSDGGCVAGEEEFAETLFRNFIMLDAYKKNGNFEEEVVYSNYITELSDDGRIIRLTTLTFEEVEELNRLNKKANSALEKAKQFVKKILG